jgi:uncharacterized iron-regulated protein
MKTRRRLWIAGNALAALLLTGCAAGTRDTDLTPRALAAQMQQRPVVLLGEVHDNVEQHAVRAQALALLLKAGQRPALAFEQFDRQLQPDIDRVRAQAAADTVDRLIVLADPRWNWRLYRPFLELAVRYQLPIVAANLSRADATRVSKDGFGAVFDPSEQHELGLDALPAELLLAQQQAVDEGHCHRMPAQMLPALARAQIARDATLARSIGPYLQRGVVLLTGNGHIRRDIGVPRFVPAEQRDRLISIALIEDDRSDGDVPAHAFDAVFRTPAQRRVDPCQLLNREDLGR